MFLPLSFILCMMVTFMLLSSMADWCWIVDFSIMNVSVQYMSLSFILEKQNSIFMFTVLTIFTMVHFYTLSYLSDEVFLGRFLNILTLFVVSMCLLILSGNLFSSLIGWDGLGVTSMFLILFYYSKSALKASNLTFLMNRTGDCFFIMTLTQLLLLGDSNICYSCSYFPWEMALLLILTSITKSAQIPFSTWLPAAMEAPTPVSALVHSSTLVTAGIYLLYRYSILWVETPLSSLLMVLSMATCFMAALSALVENDLKKLIALSTLSQLGFIMLSLSLGLLMQGFLHMIIHAYFKALLFMCAGLVIHSFKGSQSIIDMSLSSKQNPLLMIIMSCALMSMMGMPFLSGFYSKDAIVDSLKASNWSLSILMLFVLSFICTATYSVRMIWYLMNSSSNWHCMSGSGSGMIGPMIPLTLMAFIGGSLVTWLLTEVDFYIETSKLLILSLLSLSITTYWFMKEMSSSFFLEKKWNLSTFNSMMSDFFFKSILVYKYSSDLLGIPEIINSHVKLQIMKFSKKTSSTMIHYSGSLEFLMFLVMVILLM